MEKLNEKAKLVEVIVALNLVIEAMNKNADRRGPKSEKEMTDDDARSIMGKGENAALSHKAAAEKLGLSYAQVYSCRKGFTFKHIAKEIVVAEAKAKADAAKVDEVEPTLTEVI